MKRAAFDAATANKALVLWLQDGGQLRTEVFHEIWELTQRPIYLFVDQVAFHVDQLIQFLNAMRSRGVPIVLIGAESHAAWSTYCGAIEENIPVNFIRVGRLSMSEVEGLLDLLARHNCLGDLKHKQRSEQIEAFINEEQADRQLLVALHILTKGMPFETIALNEFENVSPDQARQLYLDIATMNQFSVPVRAGTISRVSGIDFREYQDKLFLPLKDMIAVGKDKYSGDSTYKTRHPRVAQILFRQACNSDSAKVAQFVRLIKGFDVGYASDNRALESICRGRSLADNIGDPLGVREIYDAAVNVAPRQAYLYQQWAIFESNHRSGDFSEAERLAELASSMDPGNPVLIHTQAEVARKRANREHSPVLKEQLRRHTRGFLEKMPRANRFRASTKCKLLVDEVADISASLSETEKESEDLYFEEKLRETEAALASAQQDFPDDAGMIETEARLWDEMKDKARALRALERAWKKMPKGSGTAVRISKIYAAAGRLADQLTVLRDALDRDPDDKAAHLAMATYLLRKSPPEFSAAEGHLRASFAVGDHNFESRFALAELLFAQGQVDKAVVSLDDINRRAPPAFRRFAPRNDSAVSELLPGYEGVIEEIREGFCFIRSGAYPNKIYAQNSAFTEIERDDIEIGREVDFRIRFNRKGAVAVEARLRGM
jgi:Tetratricopeptide repeat